MERKMKEQMEKMKELEKRELESKMQRQKLEERKLVDEKRKLAMYNEKKRQDFEKRKEEERRKEIEKMRERRKEGDKKELEDMQAKYREMERKMEEMKSRLNGSSQGSSSSSGKRDVRQVEARRFPGEKGYREERGEGSGSWKNRIESESEEEYDSELDDFIDDSDAKIDVSKEIRSIFGYDKRKYRDEDFDDRSMENNKFSSIM